MVCLFGILVIPNTFSENETDNQWGTIFIEKSVLEIPYTPWGNTDYEKIKIFGTVVEPRSATWAYLTITEPDGKTSEVTAIASGDGTYESYILICCNKLGKYTVSAEWKGHYLGIVEFDVVQKSRSIVISPIVVIETTKPSYKTGDNIFIVGNVENPIPNEDIELFITNPNGQKIWFDQLVPSSSGDFSTWTGTSKIGIQSGTYTITGKYLVDASDSATFEITANLSNISESLSEPEDLVQESIKKVPDWVRNTFIWYGEERISEDELLNAIKFLVNQGIIIIDE